MRLTLRTLLAYLDGVLDPADSEQLAAKIKESEFATGLKQRIQGIVTKPRMGAPKLDAKGLTADANNVAEYLDSSLPADRVGDFERVCLESDMSLSEAAACHQILTLVLGKPADVPVGLRERIYGLNLEPTVALASSAPGVVAPPAGIVPPPVAPKMIPRDHEPIPPPKPAPEVPEYLRTGRRLSYWPFVATLAGAFLLAAVVLRSMGPFDRSHPVLGWLGGGTEVAQVDENQSDDAASLVVPPGPQDGSRSEANPEDEMPERLPVDEADPVVDTAPAIPLANPPPDPIPIDSNPATIDPTADPPMLRPVPGDLDPDSVGPNPVGSAPPRTLPPGEMPDKLLPNDPAVVGGVQPDAAPVTPRPAETDPPPPSGAPDVGRYVSDEHVLGRYDAAGRIWVRMQPRTLLAAGERLVSLPTFRPQLALTSGVQVTLVGESAVVLGMPRDGHSMVNVDYGRLLIQTVGAAGTEIDLNLTGLKGTAILSDADSSLAIEVRPYLPPGTDPENPEALAIPVVELSATTGRVIWHEADQAPVEIPANFARTYVGNTMPTTSGPYKAPDWVDPRNISNLDRDTSLTLESLLSFDKPLNVSLQEQLQDRRVDVRALAARCLGALDLFEPLIKELQDNRQYSFWAAELDVLREAIARGPNTAAAIRESIENLRPDNSETLFRLLWGYSPEQLAGGQADQLIKYLESPEMDIRVLTFDNLRRITGVLLLYRPERKIDQNKLAVAKWKEKLKDGGVAYKVPPSPLPERKPLD